MIGKSRDRQRVDEWMGERMICVMFAVDDVDELAKDVENIANDLDKEEEENKVRDCHPGLVVLFCILLLLSLLAKALPVFIFFLFFFSLSLSVSPRPCSDCAEGQADCSC